MAKAKSGGTRSYLRGRVGADVYSIGKDGNGKKQQIVRSLAETVANPRTQAQMVNRMVMSTVMQAVSGLSQLIDHSFDGVATGQPSISEFIRRNYALVKADAADVSGNERSFSFVKYQNKGAQAGAYVISSGDLILPQIVRAVSTGLVLQITGENPTLGSLKSQLGLTSEEYITAVSIHDNGEVAFFRVFVNDGEDSTAITTANVASLFTVVGNVTPSISVREDGGIEFKAAVPAGVLYSSYGSIISKKNGAAWKHNTCVMSVPSYLGNVPSEVLPTYPTGEARFLNGGEL